MEQHQIDRNHIDTYYEKVGEVGHDHILRCDECKKLVLHSYLVEKGSCKCGTRRVNEVRGLTAWEWFKIRVGLLRFPDWDLFLAEFKIGR